MRKIINVVFIPDAGVNNIFNRKKLKKIVDMVFILYVGVNGIFMKK